jgi:hypothetical protein
MNSKNSPRKRGNTVGQQVYQRLANLQEGQSVVVNTLQIEIEKNIGRYPSRHSVVAQANRQLKKLRSEDKFTRHIFGRNGEILGWEYGKETDEERAKNTGDVIIYIKRFIGYAQEAQNMSKAALSDHAIDAVGMPVARLLAGPETRKLVEDTQKKIVKTGWLHLQ